MNTFKVMIVVCSVMATVCSGQYTQSGKPNSWMNQPANSPLVPNKTGPEDASASIGSPAAPSAPIHINFPASAFPTISQHLCTCTAVSESTAAGMIEKYQQPSSTSAAAAEQQSAPAQQSFSQQQQAPAQSAGSYSTAAAAPIEQGPSAADQFVKPAYTMSNKVTGY
ncbi:hypothetical protein DAPPUDRAFT_108525 [Daphnia pulex]|uniref:Uncharacterized protein n=1 Tax=Daphnia pulex TaxID=6669 RepID=E9H0F4_DAPPU|nr:hypothetical protein DAPPUDRAFT_108525 [Daphnia pulex]|eukprot:EFX74828.1 hypothetical protein DAPPUDRAFT_108525 [Daphnia pulex]